MTKGKFIFKKEWYSICSRHYCYEETCSTCNTGMWNNIFINRISDKIYKKFPKMWIYFANSRFNNLKLITRKCKQTK